MRLGWKSLGVLRWMQSTQTVEPLWECSYGDDFEGYKVGAISLLNTVSQVWGSNGAVSPNYVGVMANIDFEEESSGAISSIASGTGWIGNGELRVNS